MPLPTPANLNGISSSKKNGKAGPISVDDLVAQQAASQQFKPRFLTKAQRLEQAEQAKKKEEEQRVQKEQDRIRADKERVERQRQRLLAEQNGSSSSSGGTSSSSDAANGSRETRTGPPQSALPHQPRDDRSIAIPTGPRADRQAMPPPTHPASAHHSPYQPSAPSSSSSSSGSSFDANAGLTEAEQALVRDKYLGLKEKHLKKTRKQLNDKKTMFGYDDSEDTSDNVNPIFQSLASIRGVRMGGMEDDDRAGNRRTNSKTLQTFATPSHWSEKKVEEMQDRDWRIFREDFEISVRGGRVPRPIRSWQESEIPAPVLQCIQNIGYTDPTPIQRQAIPIGLKERDLIGIAETGSGKTASFVIPMLSYISRLPRLDDSNKHLGPYALILAPTRELAQQIEVETTRFTSYLGYNCMSIVGGRDMNDQAIEASRGVEIVIATPGRLKDCIDRHIIVLGQCAYVVMDEADKMVNLGFEEILNYILDSLPISNDKPDSDEAEFGGEALNENMGVAGEGGQRYRVTMLYSATMPPIVDRMARKYLRRPAEVRIAHDSQAPPTVVQKVEFISGEEKKKKRLFEILNSGFEPPIIVFATTRVAVDGLSRDLTRAGFPIATLHAGKSQEQREGALAALRSGESPILVATDVAGRGLDVPDVSLVVNFSMPTDFTSYIHRIGRTGRAGKMGTAITFLEGGSDEEHYYDLKQTIAQSPVSNVPGELQRHPSSRQKMTREMMKRKREDD